MNSLIFNRNISSPLITFVRHGHKMRGKPPGLAISLSQLLAKKNYVDPQLHKKHDIGFPSLKKSRSEEYRYRNEIIRANRKDPNLEKLARSKKIELNLDEVKKEWLNTAGPLHIRKIAEHYGVYEHLFGPHAYFVPRVALNIKFSLNNDELLPIFHGNRIKPYQAKNAPEVTFNSNFSIDGKETKAESSWTLILTNPDGHLTQQNQEYVHWMIGNIPNGDVSKGEIVVPYLQPIPPKGTGYHRHIFVLYKQDKKIDLNSYKPDSEFDLEKRTFNTFEFYKKHQDFITPAGLSFFQADWDETLKDFYHNKLNMKEPIYEYDFPVAILKDQVHYPHRQPFNLYMDRYADPKEVNKRFLVEKLSKTHPFNGPEKQLKYPNAQDMRHLPSWIQTEIRKKNLGWGRVREIQSDD